MNDFGLLMMAKLYSGNHGAWKLPDICLTGEEKPQKNSPRKLVPTGDGTRARCVTGAHATDCCRAVDKHLILKLFYCRKINHVRHIKEAVIMTSSIWPRIYIYQDNNLTAQYVI